MVKLNYYWRILATGFCFISFGIGGLVLSTLVFPVINLLPLKKDTSRRIAQRIVHYCFRFFLWEMQFVGVLRIDIQDKQKLLEDNCNLIVANHPTLIDVILIIAQLKEVDCAVKHTHWNNPFVSGVIKATGYISNSSPEQLLQECVQNINSGRSLIIFPEGTRTTPGEEIKFKRGAAHVALRCNKDLRPITIVCNESSLSKGEKWYQVPLNGPMHISVTVHDLIATSKYKEDAKNEPQATRHLTRFLHAHYQKEICSNDRFSTRNKTADYRLTRS